MKLIIIDLLLILIHCDVLKIEKRIYFYFFLLKFVTKLCFFLRIEKVNHFLVIYFCVKWL